LLLLSWHGDATTNVECKNSPFYEVVQALKFPCPFNHKPYTLRALPVVALQGRFKWFGMPRLLFVSFSLIGDLRSCQRMPQQK